MEKKTLPADYIEKNVMIALAKHGTLAEDIEARKSEFDGIDQYLFIPITQVNEDTFAMAKMPKVVCEQLSEAGVNAWAVAERNTKANTSIRTLREIMSDMLGFDAPVPDDPKAYVITNKIGYNGAGCVINKEMIREVTKSDKCVMLPSSVHEVLIIPVDDFDQLDEFSMMVSTINHSEVAPDEVLSNTAYRVDMR